MNSVWMSRLLHLVSAGRITVVDDSGPVQKLQVSERPGSDGSLGVTDGVLRVAQFGFTSSPPLKSEVVLLRLWGNRTLTLALATSHQPSRLRNLNSGDTAVHDVRGAYMWWQAGGLVVDGAGLPMAVRNVGALTVMGDLKVTGDVIAQSAGDSISLAQHLHPLQGPGSLETGAPLPE